MWDNHLHRGVGGGKRFEKHKVPNRNVGHELVGSFAKVTGEVGRLIQSQKEGEGFVLDVRDGAIGENQRIQILIRGGEDFE